MPNDNNSEYHEIAVLTRSVENVLRKLIRFLVGRISLVKLQEMIRFIYVEEAEDRLKIENPRKSVPLTKLAVLTGLDTRALTGTRNSPSYRRPLYKESSFLKEFTPAAAILDSWGSDPRFVDKSTGRPRVLSVTGKTDSFEELFSHTIKARGVTPQSLLERLADSGAVRIDGESGTVELLKQSYLPTHSTDQLGAFEMGYAAAANLIQTIDHNFETPEDDAYKFFQRGAWTYRLSEARKPELRKELAALLGKVEQDGRAILRKFDDEYSTPTQLTAGFSLFYFEDRSR